MNSSFYLLNRTVQKWVFKQNWEDLREIQKRAIEPILSQNTDVIISASTAGGKTEAAYLPALSSAAEQKEGFAILYISPLKALINDQYRRLESLCEMLDMTVTPWHGDALLSKKQRVLKKPQGILLITPESLESLLIRKMGWVRKAFQKLQYVIIDEYHAFLGNERGVQLQSLLNRLETLTERYEKPVPRIALSATLGDMDSVLKSLRPDNSFPCELISAEGGSELKFQIKGYVNSADAESFFDEDVVLEAKRSANRRISRELFSLLRGDSHLVFANSRQRTENLSALLRELCEEVGVPNEFFPHHGSLSKETREELESRLQKETLPTTAVCTMTLELGIDIGKVKSVCQVTAPQSVSALRQRLGRSGRRGESPILRMFISENEITEHSSVVDKLRLELLQSIAMIRLLLKRWYEPADTELYHFSTLVHQILAIIAQWGGVRADQLWALLVKSGTFGKVTLDQFKELLTHLGETQIITQLTGGELVLDLKGERLVDHYTFYAAFKTPEEYRLIVGEKTIGTIPSDSFFLEDQHIIFSGKRWKVKEVDTEKKVIRVAPSQGGQPPKFNGDGLSVHDRVRQEMLLIYKEGEYRISHKGQLIDFMDTTARHLFLEGLRQFKEHDLENKLVISQGKHAFIIPWMGDKLVNTLAVLLIHRGYRVGVFAGVIEIENGNTEEIAECLKNIAEDTSLTNSDLARLVPVKVLEKYDNLLPEELLNESYGSKAFDVEGTLSWLKKETDCI